MRASAARLERISWASPAKSNAVIDVARAARADHRNPSGSSDGATSPGRSSSSTGSAPPRTSSTPSSLRTAATAASTP
jgi:hypothetical protein